MVRISIGDIAFAAHKCNMSSDEYKNAVKTKYLLTFYEALKRHEIEPLSRYTDQGLIEAYRYQVSLLSSVSLAMLELGKHSTIRSIIGEMRKSMDQSTYPFMAMSDWTLRNLLHRYASNGHPYSDQENRLARVEFVCKLASHLVDDGFLEESPFNIESISVAMYPPISIGPGHPS